jgi:hypothetical protein
MRVTQSMIPDIASLAQHRHPYLERLGLIYLMKLHHGKSFGTRAGAYWRMLFTLALFPWLAEYRIRPDAAKASKGGDSDDEDDEDSDSDDENGKRKGDNDSLMSLHGLDLEIEVTRRANENLIKRNDDLKSEVENLRQRLRDAIRSVSKLERRASRNRSSKPGPTSDEGAKAAKQPARAGAGDESVKTEDSNFPGPESVKHSDDGTESDFAESAFADEFSSVDDEALLKHKLEQGSRSRSSKPGPSSIERAEADEKSSPERADTDDFVSQNESFETEESDFPGPESVKQSIDGAKSAFDDEFSSDDEVVLKQKEKRVDPDKLFASDDDESDVPSPESEPVKGRDHDEASSDDDEVVLKQKEKRADPDKLFASDGDDEGNVPGPESEKDSDDGAESSFADEYSSDDDDVLKKKQSR